MPRDAKRKKLMQIAAENAKFRDGTARAQAAKLGVKTAIRPKRADGEVWKYLPGRVILRVSLDTKAVFAQLAYENGMSQAEFGLAVLVGALKNRRLILQSLAAHRESNAGRPADAPIAQPGVMAEWRHKTGWHRQKRARSEVK